MTTTIRTEEPRELLALVPYRLGFDPQESLVVVSLRPPRGLVGLVARVDLDTLADPDQGPGLARTLVRHLTADGAGRVVVVLYTATDVRPGGAGPARQAVAHVVQHAGALAVTDVWVVGPDAWFRLDCGSPCCPPGGRPVEELRSAAVSAEMVLSGARVVATRDALGAVPTAGPAARRAARRASSRWAARLHAGPDRAAVHRWRRDGLELWRSLVAAESPAVHDPAAAPDVAATDMGRLLAALDDVLVRDAVLVTFVPGTDRVADRVVAEDVGDGVGAALRAIVDPGEGVPPDEVRTAAARRVLERAVGHAPLRGHGPGLTLLAVLAWWDGDGARAGVLVERALDVAPGYRLGVLMEEALACGMPPGWLRPTGSA